MLASLTWKDGSSGMSSPAAADLPHAHSFDILPHLSHFSIADLPGSVLVLSGGISPLGSDLGAGALPSSVLSAGVAPAAGAEGAASLTAGSGLFLAPAPPDGGLLAPPSEPSLALSLGGMFGWVTSAFFDNLAARPLMPSATLAALAERSAPVATFSSPVTVLAGAGAGSVDVTPSAFVLLSGVFCFAGAASGSFGMDAWPFSFGSFSGVGSFSAAFFCAADLIEPARAWSAAESSLKVLTPDFAFDISVRLSADRLSITA